MARLPGGSSAGCAGSSPRCFAAKALHTRARTMDNTGGRPTTVQDNKYGVPKISKGGPVFHLPDGDEKCRGRLSLSQRARHLLCPPSPSRSGGRCYCRRRMTNIAAASSTQIEAGSGTYTATAGSAEPAFWP